MNRAPIPTVRYRVGIIVVFIAFLTAFPLKAANTIVEESLDNQVLITDSKTKKTIKITKTNTLQRFNYFWSQKQPIKKSHAYQWQYQLLIKGNHGESKWVYDPKGFAREVTLKQTAAIYQVSSARSLNRFFQGAQ